MIHKHSTGSCLSPPSSRPTAHFSTWGRSLGKLIGTPGPSVTLFDVFDIDSPVSLRRNHDLAKALGRKIALKTVREVDGSQVMLRASIARAREGADDLLVLISLGANAPALIEAFGLTDADFAHADPSIDMLYLTRTQGVLLEDTHALVDRLKDAKDRAEAMALTDALTGLPNRRAFADYASSLIGLGPDARGTAYLLHLDLDRFKQVNDTFGHAAGDAVLQRVTRDLTEVAGPEDIVSRIGGDEFLMILTGQSSLDDVLAISERLIAQVSTPIDIDGQPAQVGASIGIAAIPPECSKSVDTLLLEADIALYDAKSGGRGIVRAFSSELEAREALVKELARDIKPAIARKEFRPFYQVQVNAACGQVLGAEVLARWRHPKHGLIMPFQFLYVAERAHLTERIDYSVYEAALDDFAAWKEEGIAPPHLSFNITERQLSNERFVKNFVKAVTERGINPGEIVFELVETILIDGDSDKVRAAAARLQDAGFALAIDDFGTGRAALSTLVSIPVSIVKIDRTFVTEVDKNPRLLALARAIVNIARELDLKVLAEGVERPEERDALLRMGCAVFQGYLFGRPVSSVDFAELLRDQAWLHAMELENLESVDRANAGWFGSVA